MVRTGSHTLTSWFRIHANFAPQEKKRIPMKLTLRFSTWVIPLCYAVVAITAGMVFPRLEAPIFHGLASTVTVSAAMAIYSSVASGMLALTAVVFSLAFVMIQFSATAYSPRLVLWVSRDPFMWHAVGVFTATFLYAIAALAWVDRNGSGKVPLVSSLVVIGLLLASVAMFVGLIQRIGLLQINRMLKFTGDQGRAVIETVYPQIDSPLTPTRSEEFRTLPLTQTVLHRSGPEVIQKLDIVALVELARKSGGIVEMLAAVGDTVVILTPLLCVYGARDPIDETALTNEIEMGEERTFEQDPKYAIRLLVDIAIKALSPAINDPTTAVQALNQIEDLLLRLGSRELEIGDFRDRDGQLRLVVPYPAWEDFLRLAFDEIAAYGAQSVQVMRRMKALVNDLASRLPEDRHVALHHWGMRLQSTIARSFEDLEEKEEASVEDRQGLGVPSKRRASL
jgi:uncharacterized membrane protein